MRTAPLRRLLASVDNGSWGVEPGESDVDVQCVRAADFDFDALRVDMTRAPVRGLDQRTWSRLRLRAGDLVLEKSGGGELAPVGRAVLYEAGSPAVTSNFAARVVPQPWVNPRFLVYALRSLYDSGVTLQCIKQTTGIQNLDTEHWLKSDVPAPPEEEQRRIADFLDERVSWIDQIITARREQINLVQQSLVEVRESILGGLPDRVRASRVMTLLPGFAFPSEQYSEDEADVPLLRGINVGVGSLRWQETVYWPRDLLAGLANFQLAPGDIVMGMDRPWIGSGLRIAMLSEEDGSPLLLQRVGKLTPGASVHPGFLFQAYQLGAFRAQVESDLTGLSVPHLSGNQILSYRLPFGSLAEQSEAARLVDIASAQSEGTINELRHSVGLLIEYKASIITAAVTGEIDVTTTGNGLPR